MKNPNEQKPIANAEAEAVETVKAEEVTETVETVAAEEPKNFRRTFTVDLYGKTPDDVPTLDEFQKGVEHVAAKCYDVVTSYNAQNDVYI